MKTYINISEKNLNWINYKGYNLSELVNQWIERMKQEQGYIIKKEEGN